MDGQVILFAVVILVAIAAGTAFGVYENRK